VSYYAAVSLINLSFAANKHDAQLNIAVGADLFAQGICCTVISLGDLFITYSRYLMVQTKPLFPYQHLVVALYVLVLVVLPDLPFYTVIPAFISVNDDYPPGIDALNICLYYIFAPAVALFNIFFAGLFYLRITGWRNSAGRVEQHPRMLGLAKKSAVHALCR
jgi:hypothetical protein